MVFVKSEESTVAANFLFFYQAKDVFWLVMEVADRLWVFGKQTIFDGGGAE